MNILLKVVRFSNLKIAPYRKYLLKVWREIIFFKKIKRCKRKAKNFYLSQYENTIFDNLNIKGYSFIPNFFSQDEINKLENYGKNLLKYKKSSINKILKDKNIKAINKDTLVYEKTHIMNKVITNESLIKIVSKYLGTYPLIRRADIVLSSQRSKSLKGSQYWHIDDLDTKIIKLFIYLTDVISEDYGPFILSQKNYNSSKKFKNKKLGHVSDEELNRINCELKPTNIIGNKGTTFIVDTANTPHKGSIKLIKNRLVFVGTFASHSHWSTLDSNIDHNY